MSFNSFPPGCSQECLFAVSLQAVLRNVVLTASLQPVLRNVVLTASLQPVLRIVSELSTPRLFSGMSFNNSLEEDS